MSGFEPLFMAAAEEAGTAALASEVMAPELLGTLGAEFGTEAAFSGLGGLAGMEGLTGLTGLAGEGLGSLVGSAQSAVPTLAENLAAANPEALAQTQQAILSAQPGASQVGGLDRLASTTSANFPQTSPDVVQSAMNNPAAQAGSAINTPYQPGWTPEKEMLSQVPGGRLPPGMTGSSAEAAAQPGMFDKALDWVKDNKMSAASMGLNALQYLNKKSGDVPTEEKYSGPLSKFKYNKDVYQPYIATPPTPYTPQYQDYRRYAGGGPIEAMSNANAVGANTGYPMADISKGAYATPYQTPISRNVLTGAADTGVDPMTGEMAFARGGIADLGGYSDGGRMLKGPGDGMSDNIPATIAGKQPARLANEEFVVPADVVSHLGNGSSDAGAKQLYKMMDRVRQARTGKKAQGKQINPDKFMPA